jgi:hypothetical protein
MAFEQIAGVIKLSIGDTAYKVVGGVRYAIGANKNEVLVGSDGVHGIKSMPTVPFMELTIRDTSDVSLDELHAVRDQTVTLELASGKTIVLHEAVFTGTGEGNTEDATIAARFEGSRCVEISA